MNIRVLVLAAGRASRFGSDKRLATLPDGRPVIDTLLDQLSASCLPALVCIRDDDEKLARHLQRRNCPTHRCRRAAEGMGGTLAEGVSQLAGCDGVLVSLADMPWIQPATFSTVAAALTADTITVPSHGGKPGHPVGFGSAFFPRLSALHGDYGARALLSEYPAAVRELPVVDAAIHCDIDTPADLRRQADPVMNTHKETLTLCK